MFFSLTILISLFIPIRLVEGAHFLGPIENVTVTIGRDASLCCSVANLGNHRVGWIHLKRQMIVAVHTRMITRISRYSVTHDSQSTWTLHIKGVKEEDRGYYICQVNTEPALSQVGYLQVVVPPTIADHRSSPSEIQVREKKNVTLICNANGFPAPKIRWKREDEKIIFPDRRGLGGIHDGNVLELSQVSRTHMGAYLCIASNGVPPSVSKRIILKVEFPPQIHVPNQLVAVPTGDNVTIECHVEAFPKAISFWTRDSVMMMSSSKYISEMSESLYKIHMRLTVVNFTKLDNTTYKCVAKNSLGETEGDIRLNEIYVPPKLNGMRSGRPVDLELPRKNPSSLREEESSLSSVAVSVSEEDRINDFSINFMQDGGGFPLDEEFTHIIANGCRHHSRFPSSDITAIIILLLSLLFKC